ncbi:45723_t:CDS:2 [Gigaspora margarita]|uniref:45723_t:CDS:1 n=1 Tax=Gigaspora margarita TaxID=4874 RepID=A0ABM8VXW6_GIGMA|nr:45723_t:CDS:2 [Gigaspora margarita]
MAISVMTVKEKPIFRNLNLKTLSLIFLCQPSYSNEVERSVYVAAVLHGILSAFDTSEKIILHREYSLSEANGKGRFDFTIMHDENILCY